MLVQIIITVWENIFFYLFILSTIISFMLLIMLYRTIKIKNEKIVFQEKQNTKKINTLTNEHHEILDNLRTEMVKHENERVRQWMESEKETLHVLNGVSTLLELSDKVDKSEFKNIIEKLNLIENKLTNIKN